MLSVQWGQVYLASSMWVTVFSQPWAQSIRESPGYQHAVLEGDHVELRVTLPGSSQEGLHEVALWS